MFGSRIKEIRESFKLTQTDFAKKLSTSSGRISDLENDKKIPGGAFLISLKREFKVSIDWLLTGEGEPYIKKNIIKSPKNNLVVVNHQDLVTKFKDPKRAIKINENLLKIEEISEDLIEKISDDIEQKLETALIVSGSSKKTEKIQRSSTKKKNG